MSSFPSLYFFLLVKHTVSGRSSVMGGYRKRSRNTIQEEVWSSYPLWGKGKLENDAFLFCSSEDMCQTQVAMVRRAALCGLEFFLPTHQLPGPTHVWVPGALDYVLLFMYSLTPGRPLQCEIDKGSISFQFSYRQSYTRDSPRLPCLTSFLHFIYK